jgi:glycosyltransferase involved in cell wall biosynthesis
MPPKDIMHNYTGIVAVRNGAALIRNALQSMLRQELPPKIIIVSDDGSDDGTPDLVRSEFPEIKLLCNAARGQAGALNEGLAHVDTDYVTFLDHDDIWMPQKSAIQIPLLETHPDIDAVFGAVQNIRTDTSSPVTQSIGTARALGASMFRRSCFDRAGHFRTDRKEHALLDWWSRAGLAGIKTLEHSDIVLHRYIHGDNFGIRQKQSSLAALVTQLREHQLRHKAKK